MKSLQSVFNLLVTLLEEIGAIFVSLCPKFNVTLVVLIPRFGKAISSSYTLYSNSKLKQTILWEEIKDM